MRNKPRSWRGIVARIFILGSVAAIACCSAIAGIDSLEIGACKGSKTACASGNDSGQTVLPENDSGPVQLPDSGLVCKGKPLPPMVRVGSTETTFCIDSTEVTNEQYLQFFNAKVDPTTQPDYCRWNTSFAPLEKVDGGPDPGGPTNPVVGVDHCDALAYCTWAGKYLCGKVEGTKKVGPVPPGAGLDDYRSHQWMLACSADGRQRYPYGAYDPLKCNLHELDAGRTLAVGTSPSCVGGYVGVYDMLGNVWEWYDSPCSDAGINIDAGDGSLDFAGQACLVKGGSYLDEGKNGNVDCRRDANVRRDYRGSHVGFRCCSE